HFFEGNAFCCFRVSDNLACIVVGNEAFRNQIKEPDSYGKQNSTDHHCERAMLQHDLQRPTITANQPFISLLSLLPPGSFGSRYSVFMFGQRALGDGRAPDTSLVRHDVVSMSASHFQQPAAKH